MYKHILLAVLIGLAAADNTIVKSFLIADTPVDISHLFAFSYEAEFDIYYGTGYTGGVYDGSDAPSSGYNYEKYYLVFNSFAQAGITVEFFGIYELSFNMYAEPWTFHPFEFWALWYRPIASDFDFSTFDLNLYASTYFDCLKFYVAWEEHTVVAGKSFIDWFMDFSGYTPIPISLDDWVYWES